MTRTHVNEAELVELQRKALKLFQWLDGICERLDGACMLRDSDANLLDDAVKLARDVSNSVDDVTEFVRFSRCIDGGI